MADINRLFEDFSKKITHFTGSTAAFTIALAIVVVWGISGPIFQYSETWQLVINTGTTIITFLMVFLIQKSQNKDSVAIHLKLNELIAANKNASNRLVIIEDLTEADMIQLKAFYTKLSALAKEEDDIDGTHTLQDAVENHMEKMKE